MIESSPAADRQGQRYPLSFTQEWFVSLDQGDDGGTFGPRFMTVSAVRVTGPVDLAVLQGALDEFDDRDSVLLLTVHHSVSDAWSIQVIFRDLGAFYTARRTGTAAVLPPMRQYREYAAWQRANATSTAAGAPRSSSTSLGTIISAASVISR